MIRVYQFLFLFSLKFICLRRLFLNEKIDIRSRNVDYGIWWWSSWSLTQEQDGKNVSFIAGIHMRFLSCVVSLIHVRFLSCVISLIHVRFLSCVISLIVLPTLSSTVVHGCFAQTSFKAKWGRTEERGTVPSFRRTINIS